MRSVGARINRLERLLQPVPCTRDHLRLVMISSYATTADEAALERAAPARPGAPAPENTCSTCGHHLVELRFVGSRPHLTETA